MANISQSYNSFAHDLYKHVGQGQDSNIFYSPYSIVAALSMCAAGASNNTEKQLKQVLNNAHLKNEDIHNSNAELQQHLNNLGTSVKLNVANKIFQRQSYKVRQEYLDLLRKFYQSDAQGLNFSNAAESAKIINDWVEQQTNNKIKNLVPESVITELTQLILVNAIYFRGDWNLKFDKNLTKEQPFFLADRTETKVQMMSLTGKKFHYRASPADLNGEMCRLPYAGNQLSMTIFLPFENTPLSDIEAKLDNNIINELLTIQNLRSVNVHLPKFKFEQEFELSSVISQLGAPDAFDEKLADFSGIKTNDDGLHISKVIHKAVVEVNEEGTEAAAATAVVMMTRAAVMRDFREEFICNRPFLFFIHDTKHNTILFMGKFSKPQ